MKSALVTGATGFIGKPLCHALSNRGVEVMALARQQGTGPWKTLHVCDLATDAVPDGLMQGVDTVFHLAARVHQLNASDDAEDYRRVNTEGTQKLAIASARAMVSRFVFFSSVKAVGETSDTLIDEDAEPNPVSAYGKSKLDAENFVHDTARNSTMSVSVLRLPLVYGAGVKGNLRDMIRAVARGRFPPVAECGNRRAMVHVDDVVAAALLAAESDAAQGKTYFVTDGHEYSTRQIYDSIRCALGRSPAAWSVPNPLLASAAVIGDLMQRFGVRTPFDSSRLQKLMGSARYDGGRIRRELGFRPANDFDSALPEIIAALAESGEGESRFARG